MIDHPIDHDVLNPRPDARIAKHAQQILDDKVATKKQEYGYIEGIVRQITVDPREGHLMSQFQIIDRLTGELVDCVFDPSRAEDVGAHMRHRFVVRGNVTYQSGIPKRIAVDCYDILKDQKELPQISGIQAMEVDITGGMDAADYILEGRDPPCVEQAQAGQGRG